MTADDSANALAERLAGIAEELADLALERLQAATHAADPTSAAGEERRITRARRAVEKAVMLLRPPPGDD